MLENASATNLALVLNSDTARLRLDGSGVRFQAYFLKNSAGRHAKAIRNLIEAACSDPIGALFKFLDLRKCQAKLPFKPALAHSQRFPTPMHTGPDMNINFACNH